MPLHQETKVRTHNVPTEEWSPFRLHSWLRISTPHRKSHSHTNNINWGGDSSRDRSFLSCGKSRPISDSLFEYPAVNLRHNLMRSQRISHFKSFVNHNFSTASAFGSVVASNKSRKTVSSLIEYWVYANSTTFAKRCKTIHSLRGMVVIGPFLRNFSVEISEVFRWETIWLTATVSTGSRSNRTVQHERIISAQSIRKNQRSSLWGNWEPG